MAQLLLLALVLAVSCCYAQAAVRPPTTIRWSFINGRPPKYPTNFVVDLGEKLAFNWKGGMNHDVVQLPGAAGYAACAWNEATLGRLSNPAKANVVIVAPFVGTSYYTCTVPGHCKAGQRIKVTVRNRRPKAGGPTIKWNLPGAKGPGVAGVRIAFGQTATFTWSARAAQNIWLLKDQRSYITCNFKGAVPISTPATLKGSVKVTPPRGEWYFASNIPGQCGKGGRLKTRIIVK